MRGFFARLLGISVFIIGLTAPHATLHAQNERPWEMVFLSKLDTTLYVVNEEGLVESTPLNIELEASASYLFDLAPNRQLLAYKQEDVENPAINVLDLVSQTTTTISLSEGVFLSNQNFGSFNADSSLFAFGFTMGDPLDPDSLVGGIAIWNVETQFVEDYLVSPPVSPWYPGLVKWQDEKVWMQVSSYYYEESNSGYFWEWLPDEDNITKTALFEDNQWGDILPLTGEVVTKMLSPDYPSSGEFTLEGPVTNVLGYFANREDYNLEEGNIATIIYFDETNLNTGHPMWIMDGAALLHPDTADTYQLILRDGTITDVTIKPVNSEYTSVWGTTTGWLVHETSGLVHYHYDDGEITSQEILSIDSPLYWLDGTPLGEASTGTFAIIPPMP